jgi:hypothetical protein
MLALRSLYLGGEGRGQCWCSSMQRAACMVRLVGAGPCSAVNIQHNACSRIASLWPVQAAMEAGVMCNAAVLPCRPHTDYPPHPPPHPTHSPHLRRYLVMRRDQAASVSGPSSGRPISVHSSSASSVAPLPPPSPPLPREPSSSRARDLRGAGGSRCRSEGCRGHACGVWARCCGNPGPCAAWKTA